MVKKALISGFTGHGGSYLSEVLLGKSYKVYGLIRRSSSFNKGRIDHSINDKKYNNKFFFYHGDLTDVSSLNKVLEKTGPNDDFDLDTSYVIPALVRKFNKAKVISKDEVSVWGTGKPKREFVHVDDFASAMIFTMKNIDANDIYDIGISHINVSSGEEISIRELAFLIKNIVGFKGIVTFDHSMPYGTPRKVLDATFLNQVNMTSKNGLKNCLRSLYSWYKENQSN